MPSAYGTLGGIRINEKTEVLNKKYEVIPGLYAAGDCAAGGMWGDPLDDFYKACAPLSFALNSGRIAGENALKYIGK
jgi:fumarate reductase flavoprotein subunit